MVFWSLGRLLAWCSLVADSVYRTSALATTQTQVMRIEILVKPQARINKVEKTAVGFKIFTTAPAQEGRANEAVIQLLAEYFDVAPSQVNILRGHASHKKLVEINR